MGIGMCIEGAPKAGTITNRRKVRHDRQSCIAERVPVGGVNKVKLGFWVQDTNLDFLAHARALYSKN